MCKRDDNRTKEHGSLDARPIADGRMFHLGHSFGEEAIPTASDLFIEQHEALRSEFEDDEDAAFVAENAYDKTADALIAEAIEVGEDHDNEDFCLALKLTCGDTSGEAWASFVAGYQAALTLRVEADLEELASYIDGTGDPEILALVGLGEGKIDLAA